jgi:cytoskeleton protein RodZ
MAGFGEELKSERELRGVSLEKLCAETKVKPGHFEALEQEDYRALPGGVIRRGIVRAYLSALGLEEGTWMPRFDASYADHVGRFGVGNEPDDEAWEQFANNVRRGRQRKKESQRLRWLGVLLLLLAIAGGAWALWFYILRFHVLDR